ncbi:MAG: hypothetical protein AB7L84_08190 [Acidimicrobiia bacterium]
MNQPVPAGPGEGLLRADLAATAVLVATSAAAAAAPDALGLVHAVVSCVAFVVGALAYLWAFSLGVNRSRTELVTMGGLFFAAGDVAPRPVQLRLWGALAAQVVAVVVAASVRPYTEVAFGVLAPLLGLGLCALWSGRHGSFPERADTP